MATNKSSLLLFHEEHLTPILDITIKYTIEATALFVAIRRLVSCVSAFVMKLFVNITKPTVGHVRIYLCRRNICMTEECLY